MKSGLLFIGTFLIFSIIANGQLTSGPVTLSNLSGTDSSDYTFKVKFNEITGGQFECKTTKIFLYSYKDITFTSLWMSFYNFHSANDTFVTGSSGLSKVRYRCDSTFNKGRDTFFHVGPSFPVNFYNFMTTNGSVRDYSSCSACVCVQIWGQKNFATSVSTKTGKIKPPKNVKATTDASDSYIDISWEKGTNIPDTGNLNGSFLNLVYYKIFRNDTFIMKVNGDTYSYRDSPLGTGRVCKYRVATFTDKFGTGDHLSDTSKSGTGATGKTFNAELEASDSQFTTRTLLKWNDMSSLADEIEVNRIEDGKPVQLAVVSKFAKQYSDEDGIPGLTYLYMIKPVKKDFTFGEYRNTGTRKVNGMITGKVVSTYNAGVAGVVVYAEATVNVNGTNKFVKYSDTTDNSGYYEIKDVYYYKKAEFTIHPEKLNHSFKIPYLKRTLDLDNYKITGVDFTDTSVYTISGKIQYPFTDGASSDTCGVPDVQILLNGKEISRTNSDGFYAFAIQEEKTYEIEPKLLHHKFDRPKVSIPISQNYLGLNFFDLESDTIFISVAAGCNAYIADSVQLRISSTISPACYDISVYTNTKGLAQLILPAREYKVEVIGIKPANTNVLFQIGNKPIKLNLLKRDTIRDKNPIITYDSVKVKWDTIKSTGAIFKTPGYIEKKTTYDSSKKAIKQMAKFEYVAPLNIEVNFEDVAEKMVCLPGKIVAGKQTYDSVPLMEKNTGYPISIEITEGKDKCPIKEGKLRIFDYVSDMEQSPREFMIKDGNVNYFIETGDPEIASGGDHSNQKLFYMLAEVGFLKPVPYEQWVFVTGAIPRDKTFASRSAGIPFIVLHDPPGDASYAFIEKGSTFSQSLDIEVENGFAAGARLNIQTGAAFRTPFTKTAAGVKIEANLETGLDKNDKMSKTVNLTFNERFSTTDAEGWVGYPGDVFVGYAFNMIYALADVILYDEGNCNIKKDIILTIEPQGFATTFIYTQGFIEESLIPRLEEIKRLAPKDSAKNIQADIDNWQSILRKNNYNRDTGARKLAGNKGNISISHGASYESFFESDSSSGNSYELGNFVNSELYVGFATKNETGAWVESDIGPYVNQKFSFKKGQARDTSKKITIGYHIEDNDFGDYHSIDILEDVAYGVPAFRLVSGATECPHEDISQRRNLAIIKVTPPILTDVLQTSVATFTVDLVNNSQSDETRPYQVLVTPESNPDGAIIKIAGQNINFTPANFYLKAREKVSLKLTVERGPLANQYDSIKVFIISPCEFENFFTPVSSDRSSFSVHFRNECSKVDIYSPEDNWLTNASTGDYLDVALTGYNANDPNLESLILQYRAEGKGWQDGLEIPKDKLIDQFYDSRLHTKFFKDGLYELRAVANCREKLSSVNYSNIVKGKVDRKHLELFGTPFPNDGVLNFGEDIKIICDKNINPIVKYLPGKISLQRMDNKQFINVTYQIKNDQLLITPSPITLLDGIEGKVLKATVMSIEDLSGNVTEAPIEWDFIVNRSPVFWEPNHVNYTMEKGHAGTVKGTLVNRGPTTGSFTITKYPNWLTPQLFSGSIVFNGTQDINFTIDPNINPGLYSDTVFATTGTYKIWFFVTVKVSAIKPRWVKQNIDPSKFEGSMVLISQFSTNQTDIPISTDENDMIGAFINDSLRGKASIRYNPDIRKYEAELIIYSNSVNNDSLSFRMWDAYPGIQYQARESKTFRDGADLGFRGSPFILHPKGIYQTINLNKDWNWFSLFVKNNNLTPDGIFGKIGKDTMTIIKSRDDYSQFSGGGWYGNIDTLHAGIGYFIKVPKADTVEIYGNPYGAEIVTPIDGNNSWSWVGNSDLFGSPINDKLKNLKPTLNDRIKSQTQVADYIGTTWTGTLTYLEPGKAYKIKTAVPGEFKTQKLYKTLPTWNLDFTGKEYNMNITAELLKGSQRVFDSHYLIGAFINGKCQGVAQPVYSDDLKRYIVFLTAFADSADLGKPVTLKLYDTDLGAEIPQTSASLTFVTDGIKGTIPEPFDMVINTSGVDRILKAQTSMLCYPNPFGSQIHLDLTLPKKDNVEIYITNAVGQKIETLHNGILTPGNHTWLWDGAKIPQGIYFCITRINGEVLRTTIMKK